MPQMPEPVAPRDILARLVAFPTVSSESNMALVDWVQSWLAGCGVTARRVPSADGTKAGLLALIGPPVPGGVVLSGHTDVVPVAGQAWTGDPFTLVERDGRLHGRGSCDMKGFVALALAAVPRALARGLRRPLILALSHDEEIGCLGAPPLIEALRAGFPPPAAAIIGEPTMMRVVTGHKGCVGLRVRVLGREVHSAQMHRGASAVMEAARLVDWANAANDANRAAAPARPEAALFDPPWTTLHVGMIEGGTAHNITARECRFGMDIRLIPGEAGRDWIAALRARAAEIEARMRATAPEARIEVEELFDVPPLAPEPDGAAERLARRLAGDTGRHVVSYGTEAGQFQQRGISAVVCGPGDIAQAHQADEFITAAQLAEGARFLDRLIETLAR